MNAISKNALSGLEKDRDPPSRKGAVRRAWPAESMRRSKMWVVFETVIAGGDRSREQIAAETVRTGNGGTEYDEDPLNV